MGPQAVSGNPAGKAGLADAPGVELALSRSKLYLLLSWGFLFPEEEEFYNYLQDGEFVEDGLSAVESLEKSFDAEKAAPAARDLIFFFQAEDGIRDYKVTGVQTCALPI